MKIDRGIAAAICAAVLFGLSTPIAKILVGGMSPLLLAGLPYSGSGIGLALILVIRSMSDSGGSSMGPMAIGAACLAWAIDNNLTRKVSIHDSILIASSDTD